MTQTYLKPTSKGFRQPTDNALQNGNIMNPPRYAEMGGLTSGAKSKAMHANNKTLKKPGATIAK